MRLLKKCGKIRERIECYISNLDEEKFSANVQELKTKYEFVGDNGETLEELEGQEFSLSATDGLLEYIKQTQKVEMGNLNVIKVYSIIKYVSLDISARRNLELTERMRDKGKKGTLLWVLDKTDTSMGGRLLRRWINDPLLDVSEINGRLDAVAELKKDMMLKGDIKECLKKIFDIERISREDCFW